MERPSRSDRQSRQIEPLESRQYFAAISFANHVDLAAGSTPVAIVSADFNGDGKLDIATADAFTRQVNLFVGTGAGVFNTSPNPPALTGPPVSMLVGDFNGDSRPDLAVGTAPGSTNPGTGVTIFLNKGDGSGAFNTGLLTTVRAALGTDDPIAITSGDFNGDTHLDLATANFSDDSVTILLGIGNGTFQNPLTLQVGQQPSAIVAGNFDGDTDIDLAVADERIDANTGSPFSVVMLLLGSGSGTFTIGNDVALNGTGTTNLTAADMDRNGTSDLVVGSLDGLLGVFLNNGNAVFANSATVLLPAPSAAAGVADFNFDGAPDMLSVNGATTLAPGPNSVTIATGAGGAIFPAQSDFATGTDPVAAAVEDFNGDGKPDLAVANRSGGSISILLNNSAGVVLKSTTTTLASNLASAPFGSDGQLTATVTGPGGASVPGGVVRFFDGARPIGSVVIPAGTNTALLSTSALDVGAHSIRAFYLGNSLFAASRSALLRQTITPTPARGPDLAASFVTSSVPSALVPGQRVIVQVRITNVGNTLASGLIRNALFLSTDTTVDAGDTALTLVGPLATARINLAAGRSVVLPGLFTVPAAATLGDGSLLAQLNTTGALLEADAAADTNNIAASATLSVINGFGNVGGQPGVLFTGPDADGTQITYRLIGPGSGSVTNGANGIDVSVTGTTAASALLVVGRGGDGVVQLHDLTSSGPLSLVGPTTNISGSLSLNGGSRRVVVRSLSSGASLNLGAGSAGALSLGIVDNATLTSAGGIQSLLVTQWSTGGSISAPWLGVLLSRGEFAPNLSLSGAGSPAGAALRIGNVAGQLGANAVWSINGNVNAILAGGFAGAGFSGSVNGRVQNLIALRGFSGDLAASAGFGAVAIRGQVSGARILAGASFGADGRLGGGDDTFASASIRTLQILGSLSGSTIGAGLDPVDGIFGNGNDALLAGGSISVAVVTGTFSDDSRILAASLPARVRVGAALVTTAGEARFTVNA